MTENKPGDLNWSQEQIDQKVSWFCSSILVCDLEFLPSLRKWPNTAIAKKLANCTSRPVTWTTMENKSREWDLLISWKKRDELIFCNRNFASLWANDIDYGRIVL